MTIKLATDPHQDAQTAILTLGDFDPHIAPWVSGNTLKTISHPHHCEHFGSQAELDSARSLPRLKKAVIVAQHLEPEQVRALRQQATGQLTIVLITRSPFSQYGHLFDGTSAGIDHIVAGPNAHTVLKELGLISTRALGDEKQASVSLTEYFLGHLTQTQRYDVDPSDSRKPINEAVQGFAESVGMSQMGCRNIFGICEELLMNMMIDAPREAEALGITGRDQEHGILRCGFDGSVFYICAADPYGALRRDTFYRYVGKTMLRHSPDKLLDTKSDGAGIGMVRILSGCHGLLCRVKKGLRTEVMATIDSREHLRDLGTMARSIHFYSDPE